MGLEKKGIEWDFRQLGAGGLGVIGILFMFQEKGLSFINQNQDTKNEVLVSKIETNTKRIDTLERSLGDGFKGIRDKIETEIEKMRDVIRATTGDQFTKTEHQHYSDMIESRIRRLEDEILTLRKKKTND